MPRLRIHLLRLRDVLALGGRDLSFLGEVVLHGVITGGEIFLLRTGRGSLFRIHGSFCFHGSIVPERRRFGAPSIGELQYMDKSNDPRKWRGNAPVPYYAIVLGVLVIAAIIFGTQVGRAKQNPISSGAPIAGPTTR